jgi:hypothetical protein
MLPYNEVKFLVNVDLVQGNLTSSIIMLANVKRFLFTKNTKWGWTWTQFAMRMVVLFQVLAGQYGSG